MAAISPRPWISTGGSLLRPFRPAQTKARQSHNAWTLERSCRLAVAGSVACGLVTRGSRRAVASAGTGRMAVAVESAEDWRGRCLLEVRADSFRGRGREVMKRQIANYPQECQTEAELRKLVEKKPNFVCYDGFEPSGRMHIAQGVYKSVCVNKCTKAGGQFIFWVADWFALMNDKMGGDIDKIRTVGKCPYFALCAMGASCKVLKDQAVCGLPNASKEGPGSLRSSQLFCIDRSHGTPAARYRRQPKMPSRPSLKTRTWVARATRSHQFDVARSKPASRWRRAAFSKWRPLLGKLLQVGDPRAPEDEVAHRSFAQAWEFSQGIFARKRLGKAGQNLATLALFG
eukprot:s781_g24.t1